MAKSDVKENAFRDVDLLEKVVSFKDKFYRCSWAKYEDATTKSMKLLPPEFNLKKLEDDYEHMQNMIFGDKLTFEELMNGLRNLENEIHNI